MTDPQDTFDDFFESTLCGFVITNANGIIVRVNQKLAGWSGSPPETWKGKRFIDLLSMGSRIYYETHLNPLLRMQGFFDEVALQLNTANEGNRFRVLINALQKNDEEGKLRSTYYTILKATDRMQFEKNLRIENQMANDRLALERTSVKLREQLIAVLGHDLRNPLTSINMAASLLKRKARPEELALLDSILRSGSRMEEIVRNIMDFARTRLGEKIILSWEKIDPSPVIEQVVNEVTVIYPKREIITKLEKGKSLSCDPNRLGQLLSNLLANAITHGSSSLPVVVESVYRGNEFILSVINGGQPIPAHLHQHLFNPFKREVSRDRQDGLGLGLYIAAEIAKAHSGELGFQTSATETIFTFRMNWQAAWSDGSSA